jgi:hydrogenase maturation protease
MSDHAVVGVGNQIMRDDGLSATVVDGLRDRGVDSHPEVSLDHAGTTAFFALEAIDGHDRAIIIDALRVPGADPGDVHRMTYQDGAFDRDPGIHMHDFSFVEALEAGGDTYEIPEEIVVLGMTPKETVAGLKLSDPVREHIEELTEAVIEELRRGGVTFDGEEQTEPISP